MRIFWTRHSSTQKISSSDSCSRRRRVIARVVLRCHRSYRSCSYGLLKHGLQPTIPVTCGHSCSCRITQRPPSAGRGYEVNLTVERPLFPLLTHAIPHDEPCHVVVRALMQVVGPALEHGGACHLHVKDLQPLI